MQLSRSIGVILGALSLAFPAASQVSRPTDNASITLYRGQNSVANFPVVISVPASRQWTFKWYDTDRTLAPESFHLILPSTMQMNNQHTIHMAPTQHRALQWLLGKEIRFRANEGEAIVGVGRLLDLDPILIRLPDGTLRQDIHAERIVLEDLPDFWHPHPVTTWSGTAPEGNYRGELLAQMQGIHWQILYTATWEEGKENTLDLQGWLEVTNPSDQWYRNARLAFMAQDTPFAPQPRPMVASRSVMASEVASPMMLDASVANQATVDQAEGNTLFTLPGAVDVAPGTSRFPFIMLPSLATKTKLSATAMPVAQYREGKRLLPVQHDVVLGTDKDLPLLPAGTVRLYRTARDTATLLRGELLLPHTPPAETLSLRLGEENQVRVEEIRTEMVRTQKTMTTTARYDLRNSHTSLQSITLSVPLPVGQKLTITSDCEKLAPQCRTEQPHASELRYLIDLPPDVTVSVTTRYHVEQPQ